VSHTQQQEAVRLGSLVAVLYEEGILNNLGLKPHKVGISLSKESPRKILGPALQLRENTLPAADRLATIVGSDISSTPLSDEELTAFFQTYDSTLRLLIGMRWIGFTQGELEVI
jgi:hypothetical protein